MDFLDVVFGGLEVDLVAVSISLIHRCNRVGGGRRTPPEEKEKEMERKREGKRKRKRERKRERERERERVSYGEGRGTCLIATISPVFLSMAL